MKTTITFRHMQASPAIKKYAGEKLARLEKYAERAAEAHVILSMERHEHCVEIVYSAKGIHAQGKANTSDMYASIDSALDKVDATLRRHHDKVVRSRTHPDRSEAPA